jgi:hypothetical protein
MVLHPICTFFPLSQSHTGTQCTRPKFDVPNVLVLKGSNFSDVLINFQASSNVPLVKMCGVDFEA